MSRPQIYQENWSDLVRDYIDQKIQASEVPTQAQLAYQILRCDEDTITHYTKETDENGESKYPDFVSAVKKLQTVQKHMLIAKGLDKTWNAGIVRFLLIYNHSIDKSEELKDRSTEGITLLRKIFAEMSYSDR